MAPVAGGIADREEDGDTSAFSFLESVRAPFPPVHGVVRVLAQVWAGGGAETISHASAYGRMLGCACGTAREGLRLGLRLRPLTPNAMLRSLAFGEKGGRRRGPAAFATGPREPAGYGSRP